MKTMFIAFTALAFFAGTALAKEVPCTPVTGNWKNAAKFNCHYALGGGGTHSTSNPEKKECGPKKS